MKEPYHGITSRFIREDERRISTKEMELPRVYEPDISEVAEAQELSFLKTFLANHSEDILADISTFGAVLLRGFKVSTTKMFEEAILSIQGMQGMGHLFMSEPGRTHVDGLSYVFHTNSKVKTGGTLHLGGFHNENYYSPDVPNYISFCCLTPAQYGGETGLINMGSVYEKLDSNLQEKLEKSPFFVSKWPINVIAQRYQVDPDDAKQACVDFGLPMEGEHHVIMHKPSVLTHPRTGKKIIQANLCAELPKLNDEILKHFTRDYHGLRWILHKTLWITLGYQRLRQWSLMLPELIRHPIRFYKMRKQIRERMSQYSNLSYPRLKSVFTRDDIVTLARVMREGFASFLWKPGDILLIDNLQVAHAGMPGGTTKKFTRNIRALLSNPCKINYTDHASGLQRIEGGRSSTLGEIMQNISKTRVKKTDVSAWRPQ